MKWLERYTPSLPISANSISVLSAILSVAFLLIAKINTINIFLLIFILILDMLDGFQARKEKKNEEQKRQGYIIDITFDRLSDCLTTIPFIDSIPGRILFGFSILNIFLNYYSIRKGKHYLLAVRFFLLVALIFKVI